MIKIPAETLVRMCHISRDLRFDNGVVVSTDRSIMAAEVTPFSFEGIYHITVTPELLAQCEVETKFAGSVEIIAQDALRYSIAKTTMGFVTSNIGYWPDETYYLHRWRSIFAQCAEPLSHTTGNMVWNASTISLLAKASPSGTIVFEEFTDPRNRPILVRDVQTYDWCGCFNGRMHDPGHYPPATIPSWLSLS